MRKFALMLWLLLAAYALAVFAGATACKPLGPVGGSGPLGVGGSPAFGAGGTIATGGHMPVAGASEIAIGPFPQCETETAGLGDGPPKVFRLGPAYKPSLKHQDTGGLNQPLTDIWHETNDVTELNQQDIGGCVGFDWENCLSTEPWPLHATNEHALSIYSLASTKYDSFPGGWPPDDTGSTVGAGALAVQSLGLISGATELNSVSEILDALRDGPVPVGTNWLHRMMLTPDGCGHLDVSGPVDGGHAYLSNGVQVIGVPEPRMWFVQSWGKWGAKNQRGRRSFMYMTVKEFTGLWVSGGEAWKPYPIGKVQRK